MRIISSFHDYYDCGQQMIMSIMIGTVIGLVLYSLLYVFFNTKVDIFTNLYQDEEL